ncbi:MAG: CHAT domain-containing protein [Acidimicrobiia bacterium]
MAGISNDATVPSAPAGADVTRDAAPAIAGTGAERGHHPDVVGPTAGAPQRLTVRALHGSLECAAHPVVVGHFMGTQIDGSERFLDERLQMRLSRRKSLGQYPEEVGSWIRLDTPRPDGPKRRGSPPGAVVVGLDRPGELTRERLTAAVSAALVGSAIEVLEHATATPARRAPALELLGFSAVPIGTAGLGAMSFESCLAALIDGVLMANEMLFRFVDSHGAERAWDRVRIAELEIVELLADRAEAIVHGLAAMDKVLQVDPRPHTELDIVPFLVERDDVGGLPAGTLDRSPAREWQRIIVRDPGREAGAGAPAPSGATVLEFTPVGRRARADRLQVTIDDDAVRSLVAAAVSEARPGAQVGNSLYELLIPAALKSELVRNENVQLIVDEHTADFPWEALAARIGGGQGRERELALRSGLLRQFRETEGARNDLRPPSGDNALVIGNPPAGAGFPPLAGAAEEATAIAGLLAERGFAVRALIWDDEGDIVRDDFPALGGSPGRQVLDALFSAEWRIIHIASHGRVDPDSSRSGAVIDPRISITANVVRQLPVVPELVFVNCCHLGRVGDGSTPTPHPNRLAASVARELMRIGVRAVVAAGWAVDDFAATVFASTFYDQLSSGALLGSAVHRARAQVYEAAGDSMTWAAYQCYGDPGYQLVDSEARERSQRRFVSRGEVVRGVRTVTVLAGKLGLVDFEDVPARQLGLVAELDGHLASLPEAWASPAVLYEFATAYAELGQLAVAVDLFRRAWCHPRAADAPLRMLDQLATAEVRLAQQLYRAGGRRASIAIGGADGGRLTVASLTSAARQRLTDVLRLGETGEGLAALAAFHLKAATLTTGGPRQASLAAASRYYRQAHEWRLRLGPSPGEVPIDAHHALAWLETASMAGTPVEPGQSGRLLEAVRLAPGQPAVVVDERGEAVGPVVPTPRSRPEDDHDHAARANAAEAMLAAGVLRRAFDVDALARAYRDALATRSSRRLRAALVDHLADVALLAGADDVGALAHQLDPVPAGGGTAAIPARPTG